MVKEIETTGSILTDGTNTIDPKTDRDELHEIVINLKDTIRENKLIYLTAPQIGYDKRVLVINFNGDLRTFVNPIITKYYNWGYQKETCASIPGKQFIIPRAQKIEIMYMTPLGQIQSRTLLGIAATLFQHCVEHLDGVLISLTGLEIDDDFLTATEEEQQKILDMYKESISERAKLASEEVKKDSLARETEDAIEFMKKVDSGEVTLEYNNKKEDEEQENKE